MDDDADACGSRVRDERLVALEAAKRDACRKLHDVRNDLAVLPAVAPEGMLASVGAALDAAQRLVSALDVTDAASVASLSLVSEAVRAVEQGLLTVMRIFEETKTATERRPDAAPPQTEG